MQKIDPVCELEMDIEPELIDEDTPMRTYRGKTYFFCSLECREEFDAAPMRFLDSAPADPAE